MIETEYAAKIVASAEVAYSCSACGFRSVVRVRTQGDGKARTLMGLGERRARRAATDEARASAREAAQRVGPLARCPQCGNRDERGIAKLRTGTFVRGAVLAAAMVALGFVVLMLRSSTGVIDSLLVPAACVGGVVLARRHVRKRCWMWEDIDSRTSFLTPRDARKRLRRLASDRTAAQPRAGDSESA